MTTYTDVFGGANIVPSDVSYQAIALDADLTLTWPEETSTTGTPTSKIMDVTASGAYTITLPDATGASPGETILINNVGATTFYVEDAAGGAVLTSAAGNVWQAYLTDNATAAGVWKVLQYGSLASAYNAASLAGTGIVAVGTTLSQSMPVTEISTNYSASTTDRAKVFNWTGAAGTFTLPSPITVGSNWFCYIRNSGSGALSVDPAGAVTIDGASSKSFQPGESATVVTDGTSYYTVGFGQAATFTFDYTSINIAGTGDYTLTGSELNRIAYRFTGLLTGNRNVIVPSTVQQYWVTNDTTGAFTLTIKVSGQPGVQLDQNQSAIFYCDGTDVVDADSSTISIPMLISQGGTGATTASGARTNLGSGATGDALFTSSTQADAWTALGVAQAGNVVGGTF